MNIECSICFNKFVFYQENVPDIYNIKCGHVFHRNCICDWIQRSGNCPQCRSTAAIDDVRPLFMNTVISENTFVLNGDLPTISNHAEIQKLNDELKKTNMELNTKLLERENDLSDLFRYFKKTYEKFQAKNLITSNMIQQLKNIIKEKDQSLKKLDDEVKRLRRYAFKLKPRKLQFDSSQDGRVVPFNPRAENVLFTRPANNNIKSIRPKVDTGLTDAQRKRKGLIGPARPKFPVEKKL